MLNSPHTEGSPRAVVGQWQQTPGDQASEARDLLTAQSWVMSYLYQEEMIRSLTVGNSEFFIQQFYNN